MRRGCGERWRERTEDGSSGGVGARQRTKKGFFLTVRARVLPSRLPALLPSPYVSSSAPTSLSFSPAQRKKALSTEEYEREREREREREPQPPATRFPYVALAWTVDKTTRCRLFARHPIRTQTSLETRVRHFIPLPWHGSIFLKRSRPSNSASPPPSLPPCMADGVK